MRFNTSNNGDEPTTISGEPDPLTLLPDNIGELVMNSTHDLTIYLGQRVKFFEEASNKVKGDDLDLSTCALIERLAFYESMINALVGVTKRLEERLGGVEGGNSN